MTSKQSELGFGSCAADLAFLPCRIFRLTGQTQHLQLAGLVVGQLSEQEFVAVSPALSCRRPSDQGVAYDNRGILPPTTG